MTRGPQQQPDIHGAAGSRKGRRGAPFLTFVAGEEDKGAFLSGVLRNRFGLSRAMVRRLKAPGCVFAGGKPVPVRHRLQPGEIVELFLPEGAQTIVDPEPVPLSVVYEDAHLLVLDKPAGVLVHPAGAELSGTLANGVAHYLLSRDEPNAAGPVTRLDRGTSGLVLFAKHPHAHHRLEEALRKGEVERAYAGLVQAPMPREEGVIDAPIRRAEGSLLRREVGPGGQPAVTRYKVLQTFDGPQELGELCLVQFELETGRTHQIRVHMAWIGRPIVGDPLYGRPLPGVIERQALHAWRLSFTHPITGERLELASPLPPDVARLLPLRPHNPSGNQAIP